MAKKMPNDGSLQTTKQMLDELDALMERMLSLPVNDGEGAAPMAPATEAPIVSAKLTLLAPPAAPAPAPAPVPASETPAPMQSDEEAASKGPPLNPPHFTRSAPPARKPRRLPEPHLAAPLPDPEPLTNDYTLPSALPKLEPLLADLSEPTPATTTPWGYVPLLWINQRFDSISTWLPGGAWLRSQGGRMFLGMSGVAMTLAAAGWVLKDWLGWNWR